MRVLGVNGSGADLWVSLYGDNGPEATHPGKLSLPEGTEGGYALTAFRTSLGHALTVWAPDLVVILNPAPQGDPSWKSALPRVSAETMLVLAATDMGVPVERVTHPSVRSKLSLGKSGSVRDHAKRLLPNKFGTYWTGKRDVAALAAASRHPDGLATC